MLVTREANTCNFTYLRSKLGPKLVIVNLVMEPEELRKRVLARHLGDEEAADLMTVIILI